MARAAVAVWARCPPPGPTPQDYLQRTEVKHMINNNNKQTNMLVFFLFPADNKDELSGREGGKEGRGGGTQRERGGGWRRAKQSRLGSCMDKGRSVCVCV